ncbi:MAG: hypothetical protein LWX02_05620 [Deltaproteobacteria bacterium]|jgi:hypothetical protein|nr:hypothetical protein [Deltaproteobacteria bacterium]MDL1986623.1 hypothetical protein [Deltaproteobacteria bacterium]
MKKLSIVCLAFVMALVVGYSPVMAGNGNGLPPGPRYVLNVHAYENCPEGDFTGSNRHMIAVQADYDYDPVGKNKNVTLKTNTIALTNSDTCPEAVCNGKDFVVLDGNACSKGGAEFALPANPFDCGGDTNDPACTGENLNFHEYRVFVRLVGQPHTGIDVTTCADEAVDLDGDGVVEDIVMCSAESVVKVRSTGNGSMRFDDVSRELLTLLLYVDPDGDGNFTWARYALFDPALEDYFWQWNTRGKAKAQLVFIPNPD